MYLALASVACRALGPLHLHHATVKMCGVKSHMGEIRYWYLMTYEALRLLLLAYW